MKTIGIVLAVLLTIGAALVYQRARVSQARQQAALAQATERAAAAATKAKEAEEAKAEAERERAKLLKLTSEMGSELDRRNSEATNKPLANSNSETNSGNRAGAGFGQALAKMMSDPDTRKFIREQQRLMLDSAYAPLIRKMGLNDEEADRFKNFLADQAMKASERATSLMASTGEPPTGEQMKELAETQKTSDQEIKDFLGEERYAQFQDYQMTLQERIQLNQFRQMNGGENGISEAQTEQLLDLMKQEKASVMAEKGVAMPGGQNANQMEAVFSEEGTQKLLQAQEAVNERVYSKASSILGEEQLASFGRFQTNQLQTLRMGLTMARKMFGK